MGSQHPATGGLLVNIGNVYNSQGDYRRAIETYLRALTIMQTTEGPYHEWTLMTLGNLARAYAAQGDSAAAVKYMARMHEAAETNLSLNLAIGSERDRLAYAEKFAAQTSRVISLNVSVAPNDPSAADLAAQMILQRKGRVLDSVADSMTALRRRLEPEDQKLLNELNSTVAELAKADLQGPGRKRRSNTRPSSKRSGARKRDSKRKSAVVVPATTSEPMRSLCPRFRRQSPLAASWLNSPSMSLTTSARLKSQRLRRAAVCRLPDSRSGRCAMEGSRCREANR